MKLASTMIELANRTEKEISIEQPDLENDHQPHPH